MQIVIDIPESILNTIQADEMISREQLAVLQMHILNGTTLPKGHGRLIDVDAITKDLNTFQDAFVMHTDGTYRMAISCKAPTIIEADKESEG